MLSIEGFIASFFLLILGMVLYYPEVWIHEYIDVLYGGITSVLISAIAVEFSKCLIIIFTIRNIEKPDFSDVAMPAIALFLGLFLMSLTNYLLTGEEMGMARQVGFIFYILEHAISLGLFVMAIQADKRLFWLGVILAITVHISFGITREIIHLAM